MARFHKSYRLELEGKLRVLIEEQELQQWKAAEALGVSKDWVHKAAKRLRLKTQRTGPKRGQDHPGWKGGRKLLGRYWYIYAPDHPHATKSRYVAEHRLVMEVVLGRHLLPKEVVHHRDGDPQNNSPENLAVFQTNSEHLRHELTDRVPKWTPEGLARIAEGLKRSATIRRKKADDRRRNRTSDHPASKADSSGEGPAS